MYDRDKMVQFTMYATAQNVIDELSKLDPNMQVCFCGQAGGYLHVDTKENICSFDTDTDEDWYEKEEGDMEIATKIDKGLEWFYCENCFKPHVKDLSKLQEVVESLKGFQYNKSGMLCYIGAAICPYCGCSDSTFHIDYWMTPIVGELNKKGYITKACCSGHKDSNCFHEKSDDVYVYIQNSVTLKEWLDNHKLKCSNKLIDFEIGISEGIRIKAKYKDDVCEEVKKELGDHFLPYAIFEAISDIPKNEDEVSLTKYTYCKNAEGTPYTDKEEIKDE